MFDEHDLQEMKKCKDMENTFLRIRPHPITTTNPTKMNVIVPIISEPARDIMDFTLLVTGASLNTLLGLGIAQNSSMHTSANCYVMSLVCSNLAILLEPLQQALRWIFDVRLTMNLDYVFLVTFDTSVFTVILLNIEAYVVICRKNWRLREALLRTSTALKSLSFVWIMCITLTAMELHIYGHFEKEIMHDIYLSSTVMFLIFPCFIFIMLDCFMLYELRVSKSIDGTWPGKDIKRFALLIGITVAFFLTMIPYRVLRAVTLITSFRYSDVTLEIVYTMVKMYPVILPITCIVISKDFRQALEKTLRCQRNVYEISTIT